MCVVSVVGKGGAQASVKQGDENAMILRTSPPCALFVRKTRGSAQTVGSRGMKNEMISKQMKGRKDMGNTSPPCALSVRKARGSAQTVG